MFSLLLQTRGRALLCLTAALALAGWVAALHLPIGLFPVTSFPRVRIELDAGNMPAQQMLLEVTQPLEEQTRAVPGVLDVQSTTSRGSAEIFVDFPWGADMNQALLRVDAALAQSLPELPAGTTYGVIQMDPTMLMPLASYALVSDTAGAPPRCVAWPTFRLLQGSRASAAYGASVCSAGGFPRCRWH